MKALLFTLFLAAPLPAHADPRSDRIAVLKAQITAVATANQRRQDNLPEVRTTLQPLVDELVSLVPARTEADKLSQVIGGWQGLWSDMAFGPNLDYGNIFQVVYAEGYSYNISHEVAPGAEATGYLRGTYRDAGDHLNIQFTRSVSARGWLGPGFNLVAAGLAVEHGHTDVSDQPGPVGVQGELQDTYVDDVLRIVTGKSTVDARTSLFVLTRASATPATHGFY